MKLLDKDGLTYYTGKVKSALTNYVQFTDYASDNTSGVIKTRDNLATGMDNGALRCKTKTYNEYNSLLDTAFIGKGTLENVITGKGLVSNTNYATSSTAGVVQGASTNAFYLYNGQPYAGNLNLTSYNSAGVGTFIGKGTLETVLNDKIGAIDSVLDAINGEVI